MTKSGLLKSIAQTGYNVGFGAKKHFTTYDVYRVVPKLFSLLALCFGVFQLTETYKAYFASNLSDMCAVVLIIASIIALVVDLKSKNLEDYNKVGKDLQESFNMLRMLYNEVKEAREDEDFSHQLLIVRGVEKGLHDDSISEQAIFTHIITNIRFFNESQTDWLNEQLHFKFRDKFPLFHPESFLLYAFILAMLYWAITYAVRVFYC